ncbi:MAG: RNA 2',3'-cyclic phosphodiesterase [Christensenellales bacterium]
MRLFTALLLDEKTKSEISSLNRGFTGGDVTRKENLHSTLKFLGEQDGVAADRAAEALETARGYGTLYLRTGALGTWGRNRDLVYCALKDGTGRLFGLFSLLEQAFCRQGFPKETRPYVPHITLCRRYVGACALMCSIRQNGRICYRPLYTVELEG